MGWNLRGGFCGKNWPERKPRFQKYGTVKSHIIMPEHTQAHMPMCATHAAHIGTVTYGCSIRRLRHTQVYMHRRSWKRVLLEKDCTGMARPQRPPSRTAVSYPRSGLESL